jgi:Tfp pilus assembly protein PilZ
LELKERRIFNRLDDLSDLFSEYMPFMRLRKLFIKIEMHRVIAGNGADIPGSKVTTAISSVPRTKL